MFFIKYPDGGKNDKYQPNNVEMLKLESALEWMKKFDTKYRKTLKSEKNNPSTPISTQETSKSSRSQINRKMNNQKTLKAYFPIKIHPSELFDETFNQADFALVTRRWKEKNGEHVAAR